jgi:hypothetical protein
MKFENKEITVSVSKIDLHDPVLIGTVNEVDYRIDAAYTGGRDFIKAVFDGKGCDSGICCSRPCVKVGDTWAQISPPKLPEDPKLLPTAIFERLSLLKAELLRLSNTFTISETKDLDQL